ncbi:MAG: hypothetical protein R3F62_01160 [Planctomycetota bacterium]
MKKLLVAGVVVLALGGLVFAVMNGMQPEQRLADAAPAHTVLWLEGKGMEAAWTKFKASPAYKDFERSKSFAELKKQYEQALEMAQKMAEDAESPAGKVKQAGLALDETTLFDFLGQSVGIGFLAPEGGKPAVVFMTELDQAGLAKQLAAQGNWKEIWGKLTGATSEDMDQESYEGYDIMWPKKLADAPQKPYLASVNGVLAVSHSKEAIQEVIKVAIKKAKGLGEQPRFKDEADRLPRGSKLYGWMDLDFLRNTERLMATLKAGAAEAGAPEEATEQFKPESLALLLSDLQPGRKGLAVAVHLEGNSPYGFAISASRDANGLFQDNPKVDARGLITPQTVGYVEVRDVYGLVSGYFKSEPWKALVDSKSGQWVLDAIKNPKKIAELSGEDLSRTPMAEFADNDPTFELRTALAMALPAVQELLGNDVIASLDVVPDKQDPKEMFKGVACLRVRPLLRVIYDLAAGAAKAHAGEGAPYTTADHGKSTIFSLNPQMTEGVPVNWTRVGSVILASNDVTKLQNAVDGAGKDAKVDNPQIQGVLDRMEDGYFTFVYFNQAAVMKSMSKVMEGQMGPQEKELLEAQQAMYEAMAIQAGAFYVNADYTESKAIQYQSVGESFQKVAEATYVVADSEPAAWKTLPTATFLSVAGQGNLRPMLDWARSSYEGVFSKEDQEAVLKEASKWLDGQDVVKFLEELGPAIGLGVINQPLLPGEGEASPMLAAIPGAVLSVQLKSPTEAEKTINNAITHALDELVNSREEGGSRVVETLQTISSAESLFREGDYEGDNVLDYGSLAELVQTNLVEPELAKGMHGYRFTVEVDKREPEFMWRATASPISPGPKPRYYAMDQTGVVFWMDKPFRFGENGEMPAAAQPAGFDEPGVRVPLPKDHPDRVNVVDKELAGVKIKALGLPEQARREFEPILGKGLSPCWAFHGGYLLVASSEHALEAAIKAQAGEDITKSESFKRATKNLDTKVVAFTHLSWAGVIDQINANGKLIAQNAAPAPAELQGPKMPEYPMDGGEEAYQKYEKDMDAYWEARSAVRDKQRKWREEHAEENAAKLEEILDSLKILGYTCGSTTYEKGAVITTTVSRVDLSAAKPAEAASKK